MASYFLVLGILIILMNIGLLFVHEPIETDRQANKKKLIRLIEENLVLEAMHLQTLLPILQEL